jgi:hypothetical protein
VIISLVGKGWAVPCSLFVTSTGLTLTGLTSTGLTSTGLTSTGLTSTGLSASVSCLVFWGTKSYLIPLMFTIIH